MRGGEKRSESRDVSEDQAPKLPCCTWCVGVCVWRWLWLWLCLVWLFPCLVCTSPAVCNTVLSCLAGLIRVGIASGSGCVGNGPVVWAIAGVFSSFATGLLGLLGLNRAR